VKPGCWSKVWQGTEDCAKVHYFNLRSPAAVSSCASAACNDKQEIRAEGMQPFGRRSINERNVEPVLVRNV
jgi:hypothetical protein